MLNLPPTSSVPLPSHDTKGLNREDSFFPCKLHAQENCKHYRKVKGRQREEKKSAGQGHSSVLRAKVPHQPSIPDPMPGIWYTTHTHTHTCARTHAHTHTQCDHPTLQRIAKGAGKKVPRENCRKVSNNFLTLFDDF